MSQQRTLASRTAEAIRAEFADSGVIPPGGRLPSILELRDRYGVSSSTIVQALAMLEERGLVTRRRGSGCYLSEQTSPTPSILPSLAFVAPRESRFEIVQRMCAGAEQACAAAGYHLIFAGVDGGLFGHGDSGYEAEQAQVRRMVDAGCQAVLLNPVTRTRAQLQEDYLTREFLGVPIVLLDIAYPEQRRPQVVFDNYRAGYDMTRFLLQRGHRRIAFMDVGPEPSEMMHRSTRERYRGYLAALDAAGLCACPEDHWCWTPHHRDPLDAQIAPLLRRCRDSAEAPTAVIALEDNLAVATISLAREMGIRVPERLEVVGFDNLASGRLFHPRFATTAPDFGRAGELAVELALQCRWGQSRHYPAYVLPVPVLPREAVALAEASDTLPASQRGKEHPEASPLRV